MLTPSVSLSSLPCFCVCEHMRVCVCAQACTHTRRKVGVQGHDGSSHFCSANTELAVQEVWEHGKGSLGQSNMSVLGASSSGMPRPAWLKPTGPSSPPDSCLSGPSRELHLLGVKTRAKLLTSPNISPNWPTMWGLIISTHRWKLRGLGKQASLPSRWQSRAPQLDTLAWKKLPTQAPW